MVSGTSDHYSTSMCTSGTAADTPAGPVRYGLGSGVVGSTLASKPLGLRKIMSAGVRESTTLYVRTIRTDDHVRGKRLGKTNKQRDTKTKSAGGEDII